MKAVISDGLPRNDLIGYQVSLPFNQISVNRETCTLCGLCEEICPNQIIKNDGEGKLIFRPDRLPLCMKCGQCMAICPFQSITVNGLEYERDFIPLPGRNATEMSFTDMVKTRRAIRAYKDQPVPREILEKVVQAITFAPPSFTPIKTEVVIVQDTALIRQALPEMIKVYDDLVRALRNPLARFIIHRKLGDEKFKTLVRHVMPLMKTRLPELKEGTEDTITRYAPAMIVFHAHRDAENYEQDINIALTYGLLVAHALGLGASAIDLIPPAIENNPRLRRMFSIPESNVVVASMILGYPKYRYQRGIKRNLKSVTWI